MHRKTLLPLLALAGCTSLLDPGSGEALLRTDRTEYVARYLNGEGNYRQYGFAVEATFENRTGGNVYLERCYPDSTVPIYGVVKAGGSVKPLESGYDLVWACVGHDNPIVVRDGDTYVRTLNVRGPNSWDGHTGTPYGALEGRFRLVVQAAGSCRDVVHCPLPLESAPFDVRLET